MSEVFRSFSIEKNKRWVRGTQEPDIVGFYSIEGSDKSEFTPDYFFKQYRDDDSQDHSLLRSLKLKKFENLDLNTGLEIHVARMPRPREFSVFEQC